jgi:cellulose synthase/poly-beta-1,6-N-acetylglucosamine synthase-like glycosyltransferase
MLFFLALLAAIVFCEASLLLLSDGRFTAQSILALSTVCVLFLSWFLVEDPWHVVPDKKVTTVLLGLWTVSVPVIVLSVLSFGFSRLRHPLWRHLGVLLASVAVVCFYPMFALLSVCASDIDCL